MEYAVLVLIHVASGILWAGGILIAGFFLMPALQEAGPGGSAVMAGMMKRHYAGVSTLAGLVAVLSGGRLYALRFSLEWLKTIEGMALSLGSLLALHALAIGLFSQRVLAQKVAALAREGRQAEIPPLAQKMQRNARMASFNVIGVVILMAGHRLAAIL